MTENVPFLFFSSTFSRFIRMITIVVIFDVMPLIPETDTVLDVYTLNKTSQEFSYIDFIIQLCLITKWYM